MEIVFILFKVIIYSIICYLISGFVHELGHVVMGLISGWKFFMLVIGPFEWKRDSSDEKVKFQIEKNVVMWGGMGGTLPTDEKADNVKIWSRILTAGPAASIIMGAGLLPVVVNTKSIFLLLLSLIPLAMGVMCALPLPLKTGFLYSDGGRWSRIKMGGQSADEERALLELVILNSLHGKSAVPSVDMISPLLKSKDAPFRYYGHYYMYQILKSKQNIEEMEQQLIYLNELKNKVPKLVIEDCKID